jgi:hypothetical protein
VLAAGIHVHASTDRPGRFDQHHKNNPDWLPLMGSMFGLDARNASTPGTWRDLRR